MGSMIEPLICSSLARGIRRAYFEVLDANWADFGRRMKTFGYLLLARNKLFQR
jgi:hypothetical protein